GDASAESSGRVEATRQWSIAGWYAAIGSVRPFRRVQHDSGGSRSVRHGATITADVVASYGSATPCTFRRGRLHGGVARPRKRPDRHRPALPRPCGRTGHTTGRFDEAAVGTYRDAVRTAERPRVGTLPSNQHCGRMNRRQPNTRRYEEGP